MQAKCIICGIAVLLVVGGLYYFSPTPTSAQQRLAQGVRKPEAQLLESMGPEEFDSSLDVTAIVSPDQGPMYREMSDVLNVGGDLKDTSKAQQSLLALNTLILKYPDYGDLYVMRTIYSLILKHSNYEYITSDLDNALKYRTTAKYVSAYASDAPILLLKAKVAALSGESKAEIDDFQAAIDVDPSSVYSSDFFGTGEVKPDGNSNPSAPTLADFNSLIRVFPNDFRTYMLRGIYYASFTNFDEQYYVPAFSDLKQAIALNPQSAEANYLLGELYMKTTFMTMAASSDVSDLTGVGGGYKDQQRNTAIIYFTKAVLYDQKYKYAFGELAEANLQLKNYADAISSYTSEIALDPSNAGAYNDRALAEADIDQFTRAISDLTHAIIIKRLNLKYSNDGLIGYDSYQNLGDVYVKTGDYNRAIDSYSKAIGIKFSSDVFLKSVDQVRATYPEFNGISDEELLDGLREKYFPNMTSTSFNSQMVSNRQNDEFILSDLYAARGDAYLKSGDISKASGEYARAMHNDLQYQLKPDQQGVYAGQ